MKDRKLRLNKKIGGNWARTYGSIFGGWRWSKRTWTSRLKCSWCFLSTRSRRKSFFLAKKDPFWLWSPEKLVEMWKPSLNATTQVRKSPWNVKADSCVMYYRSKRFFAHLFWKPLSSIFFGRIKNNIFFVEIYGPLSHILLFYLWALIPIPILQLLNVTLLYLYLIAFFCTYYRTIFGAHNELPRCRDKNLSKILNTKCDCRRRSI